MDGLYSDVCLWGPTLLKTRRVSSSQQRQSRIKLDVPSVLVKGISRARFKLEVIRQAHERNCVTLIDLRFPNCALAYLTRQHI